MGSGSEVLQEDNGEICSLVSDVCLAWGPCAYFFQDLCMMRIRKRTEALFCNCGRRLRDALSASFNGASGFSSLPFLNPSYWHFWLVGGGLRMLAPNRGHMLYEARTPPNSVDPKQIFIRIF